MDKRGINISFCEFSGDSNNTDFSLTIRNAKLLVKIINACLGDK